MNFFSILFLFTVAYAGTKVTVSGISSGAYMAQQFHTAYSSQVSGVGIVAGGPYFCAKGKVLNALHRCMKTTLGAPKVSDSLKEMGKREASGEIDPVINLKDSKVYLLSGKKDETVLPKVVDANLEVYQGLGVRSENINYVNDLNVGHAFPTENFGNSCETPSESPFISRCGRDVAGEILNHLLGPLQPKVPAKMSRLFSFKQISEEETLFRDRLSMHKIGYAYVPEGCEFPEASGCSIHVAFHGCRQTIEDIETSFITKAGYNDWAHSNKIVVIYPQIEKNNKLENPNGCWDWWGYSGDDYHTKSGIQMKVITRLIEGIREGKIQMKAGLL